MGEERLHRLNFEQNPHSNVAENATLEGGTRILRSLNFSADYKTPNVQIADMGLTTGPCVRLSIGLLVREL